MDPSADVVILTALPVEFQAVLALLRERSTLVHPEGTRCVVGTLPGATGTVAVARIGPGNLGAAAITERVRQWLSPQALLFVGVAGGLKPSVALGDVIVPTKVHHLHPGKEAPGGFRARPVPGAVSHRLEQAAGTALCADTWHAWVPDDVRETWKGACPRVHFEPVVAGEVVLNSSDTPLRSLIMTHHEDSLAIEMESAGVARAAVLSEGLQILTLRGISDHADPDKRSDDASGSQHRASAHAAAAAAALLCELLPDTEAHAGSRSSQTVGPATDVGKPSPTDVDWVNALMAFGDMSRADFRQNLLFDMGRILGLPHAFMAAELPMARDHVREIVRRMSDYRDPPAARAAAYTALEFARPDDAALGRLGRLMP
ncbi:5'-methylthioadenosine/S-adenosylhomocysteine nucleosidase family protein [Streptomyces antibioticus]|uniref:5'-methylthioadenosine/S-adenosylhomocysteine nucleosidase family protein n=1 Tax=Streptomyces antibioticus TaxID=1890 RepID=UPI002257B57A|nr:5'-methylthioadenosine/S-adenosylhomocysteine nucleosidase [Streptomyces antibioticus]MCX4741895.1 5'-methylthioadenosine/S-adenosylhomocysteine nucleosidase [Streptomyces antibioticus]